MIFVGDIYGQIVSVVIQNLDVFGGDGFGGIFYLLFEGVNKIMVWNKGLMYILYYIFDYEIVQFVKIYIVFG